MTTWTATRTRPATGHIDQFGPYENRQAAWKQMLNQAAILAAEGLPEDDEIMRQMTVDPQMTLDSYQADGVVWTIAQA